MVQASPVLEVSKTCCCKCHNRPNTNIATQTRPNVAVRTAPTRPSATNSTASQTVITGGKGISDIYFDSV